MAKYLIKVSQPANVAAGRIAASVRTIGSHFATHATWQQHNGVAIGSLVVEADDRWWAFGIVPPNMRSCAEVVQLEAPSPEAAPCPSFLDRGSVPYPLAA